MEFCGGGDLYHKIMDVGFSGKEEIYCLFKQLLLGVSYIHSVGVAHRDLKPENLLLDNSGRILKLTDFGSSCVYRSQFEKNAHKMFGVHGSTPYIAPEEFLDTIEGYIPSKIDIWACGMILYAMLNKTLAWHCAKDDDPIFLKYLKRRSYGYPEFEVLDYDPKRLLYIILEPDPNKRPEIVELVLDKFISSIDSCMPDNEARDHHH
jgi:protein-serine/threonine kinase